MSRYIATVIKTGNSYALRVPKEYVGDARLELGAKVELPLPIQAKPYDPERLKAAVVALQRVNPYKALSDPVAWQREIRRDRPLSGRE